MNKKADIPKTILVIMTLVLVAAALLGFIYGPGKIEVGFYDARFLEQFYVQENAVVYGLDNAITNAIIKSYGEMISERKLFDVATSDTLPANFAANLVYYNFQEKIKKNLAVGIDKMEFPFLSKQQAAAFKLDLYEYSITHGDFPFVLEVMSGGNFVNLSTKAEKNITFKIFQQVTGTELAYGWEILPLASSEQTLQSIIARYMPRIHQIFNLTELGLHSFGEIYTAAKNCRQDDNFKFEECLNTTLYNFKSKVQDITIKDVPYKSISLTSKKEFLVDGQSKSIALSFKMQ